MITMNVYVFPLDFFLCTLACIYFIAFSSVLHQVPGLYGKNGLEPVDIYLNNWKQRHGLMGGPFLEKYLQKPTLLWLADESNVSLSFHLEIICMIGMVIAILAILQRRWRHQIWSFGIMWLCYLSITHVGQTFMQFQWDSFLLEVGFLSIWLACGTPPSASIVWTLRYLFFKFMFMSGAVKIQAGCPTWLGLTALEYHYATQPLPLPLSWYAHQLPPIIHRFSVGMTLLFEGPLTFFIMAPLQVFRQYEALIQVILQIFIMLTGNYNFFNLLTTVMALSLIDIQVKKPLTEKRTTKGSFMWTLETWWYQVQTCSKSLLLQILFLLGFTIYSFTQVLAFKFVHTNPQIKNPSETTWEEWILSLSIVFLPTVEETQVWIARVLPPMMIGSFLVILFAGLWQIATTKSWYRTLYLIWTLGISLHVFAASTLTLATLDRPLQNKLPSEIFLHSYLLTEKFRVVSPYGLFRKMTGVGAFKNDQGDTISIIARPEIVLEGTSDHGQTWKEYHFKYKPGDLYTSPRRAMPYQPRLDWQMWFAALGDYQGAPWLVHLIDKLLDNTKEVKHLLDETRDPFPNEPPQAIRTVLYYYDYTRWKTKWSSTIPNAFFLQEIDSNQWWHRFHRREYLPALEKKNPTLQAFLQQFGWGGEQKQEQEEDTHSKSTCEVWWWWWCPLVEKLIELKEIGAISLGLSIWVIDWIRCQLIQSFLTLVFTKSRPQNKKKKKKKE